MLAFGNLGIKGDNEILDLWELCGIFMKELWDFPLIQNKPGRKKKRGK